MGSFGHPDQEDKGWMVTRRSARVSPERLFCHLLKKKTPLFTLYFSPLRKLFAGSHTVKLNREHYMFTYKIHILKCANYANNSLCQNSAHTEHFHEKDVLIKTVYFSRKMVFEWAEKSCTLDGWCKESRLSNI